MSWSSHLYGGGTYLVGSTSSLDIHKSNGRFTILQGLVKDGVRVALNAFFLLLISFMVLLKLLPFDGF